MRYQGSKDSSRVHTPEKSIQAEKTSSVKALKWDVSDSFWEQQGSHVTTYPEDVTGEGS